MGKAAEITIVILFVLCHCDSSHFPLSSFASCSAGDVLVCFASQSESISSYNFSDPSIVSAAILFSK